MMIDDSTPTQERRKLVKTYKNVLPRMLTVVAKVSKKSTIKLIKRSRETAIDRGRGTQNKGES